MATNDTQAKRGRKANELTQAKKDSAEARSLLLDMVRSYCSSPSPRKAKVIMNQLENVEVSETVIREALENHEAKLFGLDEDDKQLLAEHNGTVVSEEDDSEEDSEEDDSEEEEETKTPQQIVQEQRNKPIMNRPAPQPSGKPNQNRKK